MSTHIYLDWGSYVYRNPQDMSIAEPKFILMRSKGYQVDFNELNQGTGWTSWRGRIGLLLESLFPASP